MAVDAVGTGPTGVTNGAIGSGVIAFRMEVVLTAAGVPGDTIPIRIGTAPTLRGAGVINKVKGASFLASPTLPSGAYGHRN